MRKRDRMAAPMGYLPGEKPDYYPEVAALSAMAGMRLSLKFTDGNEGVADLSDVPKERSDCPWKTQQEFEKVKLIHGTASWDNGKMIINYSPTDLYVRAGFARWEDMLAEPYPEKPRALEARDIGEDTIFVRLSTGLEGQVKVTRDMLSDKYRRHETEDTCVALWGSVLWRNRHEINAETLNGYLTEHPEDQMTSEFCSMIAS